MKSIDTILFLTEGVKASLEKYEAEAKKQGRKSPFCGCGNLTREDSKESIQRRILVIREELLKLSQSL